MNDIQLEEHAAAHVVASLQGGKRYRVDDSPDAAAGVKRGKMSPPEPQGIVPEAAVQPEGEPALMILDVKPFPFFRYTDFSKEVDPDSLIPLTMPGRVPNFPAKMHAILCRPELADIVSWLPHGRSWRILKPREFEVRVIPTYFEHTKFSSFIRQANGWGFRRVTQGRDRNSYYHEMFLRGLPHLCKTMKRPGVAKKQASDPEHEPDLYNISELHPVPDKATDDSILLQCTVEGGPKARMPVYCGSYKKSAALVVQHADSKLSPSDCESLGSFQQALGSFENQLKNLQLSPAAAAKPVALPASAYASATHVPASFPVNYTGAQSDTMSTLAAANQLAFGSPNMAAAAAFHNANAASQFAAGFVAAVTLSQQQFRTMLESFPMPPPQPPANGQNQIFQLPSKF
jgi:hypothetical protein